MIRRRPDLYVLLERLDQALEELDRDEPNMALVASELAELWTTRGELRFRDQVSLEASILAGLEGLIPDERPTLLTAVAERLPQPEPEPRTWRDPIPWAAAVALFGLRLRARGDQLGLFPAQEATP
jgi:hypothetical protein